MASDYSRRRVFRLTSAAVAGTSVAALAGCSSLGLGRTCELHHEVLDGDSSYGGTELAYAELSDRAKELFRKALKQDSYVVPYRGGNAPPEFSYSDEASAYIIDYEGTNYTLMTYTSQGCTVG
ncbi:hypothetical protein M0R89_11435 [Halorussus limi]|uniref:DUF7979 domain-containing protein n=1 Tax=Halorussus limi TaxID=2938695 RepID=A0A8U0HQD5_9EURY|nr:hypothetical protein [Halorussus limi]UPV73160.1 hypothetical protein M0R89_11435 [Halorussus limi]